MCYPSHERPVERGHSMRWLADRQRLVALAWSTGIESNCESMKASYDPHLIVIVIDRHRD
ncbi:hypothetical protein AAMO2058_001171600 [Amorphochlora amoebiformis]